MAKLGNIVVGVGVGDINLPSKSGGSSTPDEPSTLAFILIWSSSFVPRKNQQHLMMCV